MSDSEIRFRLGLRPDTAGGAYSAPRPISWIKGSTSKGKGGSWEEGMKGGGREGKRKVVEPMGSH